MFASLLARINRIRDGKIPAAEGSFYDLSARTIDGKTLSFSQFRNRKVLIVNTASRCGYTPQLASLEKLYRDFRPRVEVLAFPSNDFLRQEPNANGAIEAFCRLTYGTTFSLFEKTHVRGRRVHPVYRWLGGKTGALPGWNFWKYLVDVNGEVAAWFDHTVNPLDKRITDKLRD